MSSAPDRTPRAYFDAMYEDPDPWAFETSWYERRKYDLTLASLPQPRYRRAFEPGCSIGVLTESLAARCDELLAVELHPAAAARARQRLKDQPHVSVEEYDVASEWPEGTFDLIVLSEIAYYLDAAHLAQLERRVIRSTEAGGDLILVHWTGPTDYPQSGDEVHDRWTAIDAFELVASHRDERFRLNVLRRRGGGSPR